MEKTYEEMVSEQLDIQVKRGGKFNLRDAAVEIAEREGLGEEAVYPLVYELMIQSMARGALPEKVPSERS
jgi:hypothetical protein